MGQDQHPTDRDAMQTRTPTSDGRPDAGDMGLPASMWASIRLDMRRRQASMAGYEPEGVQDPTS
jgi:hypothetical protein